MACKRRCLLACLQLTTAILSAPSPSHHHLPPYCSTSSSLEEWLLYDGMKAQLLDPQLAITTVQFVELQVGGGWGWIRRQSAKVAEEEATRVCTVPPPPLKCTTISLHPPVQARWLVSLLQRGPEAAKAAFALIPESGVRDMTAWLRCGGGGGVAWGGVGCVGG